MVKVNCPKCTKLISKSNLSKHLKCCKCTLIIDGRRDCRYCGKNFLSYNTTRHEKVCKKRIIENVKNIDNDKIKKIKNTFSKKELKIILEYENLIQ